MLAVPRKSVWPKPIRPLCLTVCATVSGCRRYGRPYQSADPQPRSPGRRYAVWRPAKKYGHEVLLYDTISIKLSSTADQAFDAFLVRSISINMVGDTNDYVGKGLSGGRIVM